MQSEPKSAYIHIPFCTHKCSFCDFAAFAGLEAREDDYVQALTNEMKVRLANRARPTLDTLFYGGGTPGLLEIRKLSVIQEALLSLCNLSKNAEVSLETTPHAITAQKARAWSELGINRLSIGIESLSDYELKEMGRDHSRAEALAGLEVAANVIDNLSIDFMYGLPGQTLESFAQTLQEALDLARRLPITHISAYGLEIAINSPLLVKHPRESSSYPSEEETVKMYDLLIDSLAEEGFAQYEVSNFAKPGFESRHNLTYWKNEPYFAFGVGAHRYVDGVRSGNSKSFNKYVRDFSEGEVLETIDEQGRIQEGIMLGLRLTEGIDLVDFEKRYGVNLRNTLAGEIDFLQKEGFLAIESGRLKITRKGMPLSNSILARLI